MLERPTPIPFAAAYILLMRREIRA